jgi:hypothetical protein
MLFSEGFEGAKGLAKKMTVRAHSSHSCLC